VSWDPNPLTASYAQGQQGLELHLQATLSSLPSRSVYAGLVDDAGGLQDTQLEVESAGGNSFETWVHPSCALAPGDHQGHLTLMICQDASCAQPYALSGNVLPYRFTVSEPSLAVTIKFDGVTKDVALACNHPIPDMISGQTITLEASVPVEWSSGVAISVGDVILSNVQSTATTWSATVTGTGYNGAPLPPGASPGSVSIGAHTIGVPYTAVSMAFKVVGG